MKKAAKNLISFLFVDFLSSVLLPVTGAYPPMDSPDQVFAVAGEDVTLHIHPTTSVYRSTCVKTVDWSRVDGPQQLTVHVERNGEHLIKENSPEYHGRTNLMSDGSLVLRNVTQRDSGKYRCILLTPGSRANVEMFVSLTVGVAPMVIVTLQRTSANEIFLHCDSRDWNRKPQISLLDGRRKDLPAKITQAESDNLSASVNAAAAKETGIIICRVEIPGTSVVKETQISVRDEFYPLDSGHGGFVLPLIAFTSGVLLTVAFYSLVSMEMIKNLSHSLRGLIGGKISDSPDILQFNILDKDYGDITKVETTGTLKPLISHNAPLTGVEASHELARRDLEGMNAYKDKIISAAKEYGIHPAIIAAIISRQSQFGATLRPNGFGHTDRDCFGLMQINKNYHTLVGGPYDEDHLKHGASILVNCIETMKKRPNWTKEQQLKGVTIANHLPPSNPVLCIPDFIMFSPFWNGSQIQCGRLACLISHVFYVGCPS
ncbi:butyrophilin subfamily 2 member A2-like isoform X2 [Channa argus]|uniref:butyrophilin subfamily 2 member A2-like isoform X2 n=1 Tax=Channa argus TaxID=215402 RepID=UPI0035228826